MYYERCIKADGMSYEDLKICCYLCRKTEELIVNERNKTLILSCLGMVTEKLMAEAYRHGIKDNSIKEMTLGGWQRELE